ncbi:Cytochrome P450 [Dillenia turbinata]|uniref:Cytochrome P450 n=1 Tax=Dillenia turbinata TaxID=194707 RepID=A0AAN8UZ14_9MAGN
MKTHDAIFANRQNTVATDAAFFGGNDVVLTPYESYVHENVPVNLWDILLVMLIKLLCEFGFGEEFEGEHAKKFKTLLEDFLHVSVSFSFKGFFPSIGWMDKFTGFDAKLQEISKELDAFLGNRDHKLWNMPEDFQPERYYDNPVDFKGQHFEFLPFGSRRRGCPGIAISLSTVEYVLAHLLYWFNWDLPKGKDLDMSESFGAIIHMKNSLHLVPTPYCP